jgi:hypothetical protein
VDEFWIAQIWENRSVDYLEFKRQVLKAGLTVNEFAALIHVRPNAISNLRKKEAVPVPYAVIAVLCAEAKEQGMDFRNLLVRNGVASRSAAGVAHLDDYRKRSGHRIEPKAS